MGGCCCCSSRIAGPSTVSTYYYFSQTSEEQEPLSAHPEPTSDSLVGLLVDTDLDTSFPDSYTPPPLPAPFDVDLIRPLPPSGAIEDTVGIEPDSSIQFTVADSVGRTTDGDSLESLEKDLKKTGGNELNIRRSSTMDLELEELKKPSKSVVLLIEECPICLEEYDEDNPKILTKCCHHFHLACILEWMERSETCPVCDKELEIDETVHGC